MKKCSKCAIEKHESEFHANKRTKSGVCHQCKICVNKAKSDWKVRNRERYLEINRNYAKRAYAKDPKRFIERHNNWKINNPEILVESNKKSCKKGYEKFKSERLEYGKLYRQVYAEEKKQRDSEWRLRNPDKVREYGRKSAANQRKNSPLKVKARMLVQYAVEIGILMKPTNCSKCLKECKPEGHHPDYSKPLEVIWLCRECHNKEHGK